MYTKSVSICFFFIQICYSQNFPSVESHLGKIKGHYHLSANGNKYEAYEGVPYALPPIGDRRFMPPEPVAPWQEELDASEPREVCIGRSRLPIKSKKNHSSVYVFGVEDCLYLNVYAPIKKVSTSLPVIIWIYGGAFQYATFMGTEQNYLIDHDVIFVSFSYRHGSLGFLSTEDEVVAGNMGLKDQAMVLKWVSENIIYFGGDPKKITLAGLSAGGASVHYHYLSKMSAGLFRTGISFSGTSFNSWTQAKDSRNKAIRLAQLMNCSVDDVIEMVNCLKSRPAYDIVEAQAHFMPWHLNEFSPFGPVVEKHSKSPFIDRSPIDIINSGDVYDVPWITGVVSEEGLYPVAEFATNASAFEDLNENWDATAPHLLQYYYTVSKEDHTPVAQRIRKHYFGNQPITRGNIVNLTQSVSDRLFVVDAEKAARAQAKVNKSPVWFYYYSYRADGSLSNSIAHTTENFGVSHADDVYLVLASPIIDPKKKPEDFAMHQDALKFWLSVARDGTPKSFSKWTPIDTNDPNLYYLHMVKAANFREEENGNLGDKNFWKTIDFNENIPMEMSNKAILY